MKIQLILTIATYLQLPEFFTKMNQSINLPYFDQVLTLLEQNNPEYEFLRSLQPDLKWENFSAFFQTLILELISRLGLLRYMILSFSKSK